MRGGVEHAVGAHAVAAAEQHDALGQHPCFFTQHSGVSEAREPLADKTR